MTFKEAIKLLTQAETKARKLQAQLDACHTQFDNAREVINHAYKEEWIEYCVKHGLAKNYTFNDTLC